MDEKLANRKAVQKPNQPVTLQEYNGQDLQLNWNEFNQWGRFISYINI